MIKEVLFWLCMLTCMIALFLCNQYAGYRQAERDILKSCVANNELVIDDIKFACIKCPSDKKGE